MTEFEKKPNKEVKKEIPTPKKEFEATYTLAELVDAAADFGTTRIVVRAALTKAGKDAYTLKEAKNLIDKLKNREVRA